MANGILTCEKSMVARAERLSASYEVPYPELRWKTAREAVADAAERFQIVQDDIEAHPRDSDALVPGGWRVR